MNDKDKKLVEKYLNVSITDCGPDTTIIMKVLDLARICRKADQMEKDKKLVSELLNFALEIGIILEHYKPGDDDNERFEQWLIKNERWVRSLKDEPKR